MLDLLANYKTGIILSMLGLAGFGLIWFSSPWGIGVGYDSIFYLSAADNLLSGLGLSRLDGYGNTIPLTHFPPFYSLLISGISFLTGYESDLTARILAAGLFATLVGITGWLVFRYTNSLLAGGLGSGFVLVSPILLDVSFMAMSELPFLVLLLLMIHFLNQYLLAGKKLQLLVTAILAALMYLTRYVGITAIALGGLSILFLQQRTWAKKVRDAIIFGLISLIPMLIFYARNRYLTGSMTNRVIAYHPPTLSQIQQGVSTVSLWLLPARINPMLRLIVLVLFLITIVTLIVLSYLRGHNNREDNPREREAYQYILVLVVYAAIYIAMVAASLTFFDASTKLNNRILSPLYLIGVIAGLITVWNSAWFEDYRFVKYGVITICLVFLGVNFLRSVDVINSMRNEGKGFSGKEWRSSETIAAIAKLPPDTLLFSNEAFAIYYLAGVPSNWIPENYDPVKGQKDENYAERIRSMQEEIISQNGALVVFNSINKHNVYAPIGDLSKGLSLFEKGSDGAIYSVP